jgi:hypothetical protein
MYFPYDNVSDDFCVGMAVDVSLNTTLPCTGNYNETSPSNEPVKCNISYDQFNRIIEDGDK